MVGSGDGFAGDYRPRHQLEQGVYSPRTGYAREGRGGKSAGFERKGDGSRKMYIASIVARRMPGSANPDDGYISGLRAIVAKYPREVEARLYLSLHLMRGFELLACAARRHHGSGQHFAHVIERGAGASGRASLCNSWFRRIFVREGRMACTARNTRSLPLIFRTRCTCRVIFMRRRGGLGTRRNHLAMRP